MRIPLQIKLLIVLLTSLILAALVFYGVYEFGNFLVWRYYLGESDKQERAEQYAAEFQEYVKDNKLSVNDTAAISHWNPGWYADMIVYKDQALIYAPEWFQDIASGETESPTDGETVGSGTVTETDTLLNGEEVSSNHETDVETEDVTSDGNVSESDGALDTDTGTFTESASDTVVEDESGRETGMTSESETETERSTDKGFYEGWFSGDRGFEQYLTEEARRKYSDALSEALSGNNKLHPIYFVDGTLLITIVDFTEEAMTNVVFAISIISALAVIALIAIVYFSTVAKRINTLAANVRRIEEGDMDHRISESGNDEISDLASDVNSMRDAIVDNMTKEKRAWEANAGLITAMSHDIRTPLTVMLGYLDLIEMQNEDETTGDYIESCRDNALRLKKLSDDMFSYFLVFGKGENAMKIESINASEWLGHVLLEQEVLLAERGYIIECETEIPNAHILIDEAYFRRVTDNLFSNITKYADVEKPIRLSMALCEDVFTLTCSNIVRKNTDKPESNGIGLKTCVKIMEEMGGGLTYFEENDAFTVKIDIPCEKK